MDYTRWVSIFCSKHVGIKPSSEGCKVMDGCVKDVSGPRECGLLCFINLILGNHYGPGVSSCLQTSDNMGWLDPHPSH